MRIIAGKYRGQQIFAPKGRDVRPTTDRVREAIFSSLTSYFGDFDNLVVLDAFAGSGALGFEAVSRGACKLISCEKNFNTYQNLQKNFDSLKLEKDMCALINTDATRFDFSKALGAKKFSLLFFDPPYKYDEDIVYDLVKQLENDNLLTNKAMIVYEHQVGETNKLQDAKFELFNSKNYGDTSIDYYVYRQENNE